LLPGFLGETAPLLFAIALIAAGQSSTITGTLAGQIVMEGYLNLRINPMLRRLLTRLIAIIPAVITIAWFGEGMADKLLVFSQVVLSLQLGFAIIPLIHFVSDKDKMGKFAINRMTKAGAWLIASILIYLNVKMLTNELGHGFFALGAGTQIIVTLSVVFFASLLVYVLIHPLLKPNVKNSDINLHPSDNTIQSLTVPLFNKIAVALDFSKDDSKIIAYALAQGTENSEFQLIHIVESVSASISGNQSDDFETRKDKERLEAYVQQLAQRHVKATAHIGHHDRKREIVRIVAEQRADLLVIGAHGHHGLKDFIYGETVDAVRHKVKVPVLVVNL
jgi:manganese transport protein